VYYIDEELYYSIEAGEIQPMPSKKGFKKVLNKHYPEHAGVLTSFKWKPSSKDDLSALFSKYNEIL